MVKGCSVLTFVSLQDEQRKYPTQCIDSLSVVFLRIKKVAACFLLFYFLLSNSMALTLQNPVYKAKGSLQVTILTLILLVVEISSPRCLSAHSAAHESANYKHTRIQKHRSRGVWARSRYKRRCSRSMMLRSLVALLQLSACKPILN